MAVEDNSWRKLLEGAGLDFGVLSEGVWNFVKDPQNKVRGTEKYKISYGLTSFDFNIDPERVVLEWDANLPDYMNPGQGRIKYFELLNWLMARIPSRLFPTRHTDTQLKAQYMENSSFELVFDDARRIHKLYSEEERMDFALSFIKPDEKIKRLIFNGSPVREFVPAYILGIDYGSDIVAPKLSLSTHMEFNGHKAWNSDTVRWVLGTHRNGLYISDSKEIMGNLSEGIMQKVLQAFQNKPNPYLIPEIKLPPQP